MIRVAFVQPLTGSEWLGGLNYFRNLFNALHAQPDRTVEPVVLCARAARLDLAAGFPPVDFLRTAWIERRSAAWWLRKATGETLGFDPFLEGFMRRRGIRVLSHSAHLGRASRFPTLPWIADFQHVKLPQLFTPQEIALRESEYRKWCRNGTRVILSSQDARNDLASFAPEAVAKVVVLPFVAALDHPERWPGIESLQAKHGFEGRHFLLPNQFWVHKNHRLAVDALRILRGRRVAPLVLATGNTQDYRQPGHFPALMEHARACGVSDAFRVLGIVPFPDLMGLMRSAVAIINPSRSEGWSTSVEEAKTLGKQVLLSSLPVHREQAPERAAFFDPDDAGALADAMQSAWEGFDPEADAHAQARAAAAFPARQRAFARAYEALVHDVAGTA